MKMLLLIFLLIFEQPLIAQQVVVQDTTTQENNRAKGIWTKTNKLPIKLDNIKSNVSTIAQDKPHTSGENLVIKNLINNGDIVFDIGANTGDWTNQVLSSHAAVCIFLFEPLNFLVESMKKRFKDKNVKIYETVLFSKEQIVNFNYYEDWPQSSSIYPQNWFTTWLDDPKLITIKAVQLDKFCADNKIDHIDFLNVDVEGGELDVLKGSSDLLKKHAIDFIQFTYQRAYLGAKISLRQIYDLLTSFKYSIFREYTDGLVYVPQWNDSLENYRRSSYIAISNFNPKEHPK